ncbi:MAG: ATP-binding protein [Alkalispirochaetaceae bacterium]
MPGLVIVTGHYGTGKSEFSVNLALKKRSLEGEAVTLVDLDIVNPYFRSREARGVLEAEGIRVISNSLNLDTGVDLPAISPAVAGSLEDRERTVIVDLGGDPVGARVMRRFRTSVPEEAVEVLYVVNLFRPENATVERTRDSLRGIEESSGLRVTGLVNNAHLLDQTRPEHLLQGDRECRKLSRLLELPIRYVSGRREVLDSLLDRENSEEIPAGEPLEIEMYLRQEWMASTETE